MRSPGILLSLLWICTLLGVEGFDPYAEGQYPVRHKVFYDFLTWGLSATVDVWAPDPPAGSATVLAPVLYFVSGFGGLMPGDAYDTVFRRVASHGYTVINPHSYPSPTTYQGVWIDDIIVWMKENLDEKLQEMGNGDSLEVDFDNAFFMANSAGGHIVVEFLKHHCGDAKGLILLSPVDGFDPYGFLDIFAITPGEYLNFAVPTVVIGTGFDSKAGMDMIGDLVPPCAPEDLSNLRFYDALPGNTWWINATEFGHGDVLEEFYVDAISMTHFCAVGDTTEEQRNTYKSFIAGQAITLMNISLDPVNCDMQQYLEDPAVMPIKAEVKQKDSVAGDRFTCGQNTCNWQEEPFPHS